jgi:hypothetical protein
MISSAMASDPEVKSLLSSTSADERRGFAGTSSEGSQEEQENSKQ